MIQFVTAQDFILQSLDPNSPKIESNCKKILLVKANWCGHCRSYMPQFEEFSQKYPDAQFLVLESDDNQRLLESWQHLANPAFPVNGFPTVVFYDENGRPVQIIHDRFKLHSYL